MNRSELIARLTQTLANNPGPDTVDSEKIEPAVKILIDSLTRSLVTGQRIEIRGFGSFEIRYRPARIGRNPRIGEIVSISEKHYPHFKPGKELKERVNLSMQAGVQLQK